jgi:hypothetical protein
MLKQIVKESVKIMIDRPRIIRLAFLTSYSYTMYQIYCIIYFINWLIDIQYNSGVDISDAMVYFVNAIQRFNITRLIVTIIIIFILGLFIFWPIWRQALLYSIDNENISSGRAFIKWWKKWWIMAEFGWINMWWLSMWSVFIFVVRFWMLGYLNNPVIITVFIIWWLCVLGKTVLRPYVNYYIILKDCSARDAVIKSMSLAFSNLWLTLRGLIRQAIIRCRFLLNSWVVIWVPIIIMVFSVKMGIISNSVVEILSRVLISFWLFVFVYLEAIFMAFDYTYWYKIFLEAERRNNLK